MFMFIRLLTQITEEIVALHSNMLHLKDRSQIETDKLSLSPISGNVRGKFL